MRKDIYGDDISYVSNEMSSIPVNQSNLNEQNRIKFVTDLAAVSRGKDESKNPPARYKSLLKEAAPTSLSLSTIKGKKATGSPSRPLEFLPLFFKAALKGTTVYLHNVPKHKNFEPKDAFYEMDLADFFDLSKYSYVDCQNIDDGYYNVYTNMRAAINAGIPYNDIPYNTEEELSEFRAVKASIPMFVWAQVPNTHTQISKEAQSDRVAENNSYWLPSDFRDRLFHLTKDGTETGKAIDPEATIWWQGIYQLKDGTKIGKVAQHLLMCTTHEELVYEILALSQIESQGLFKVLGYPREIWSRAMYYFKYKEVVMTGWLIDPNVWKHLFLERNAEPQIWGNWTQSETSIFVNTLKEVIYEDKSQTETPAEEIHISSMLDDESQSN